MSSVYFHSRKKCSTRLCWKAAICTYKLRSPTQLVKDSQFLILEVKMVFPQIDNLFSQACRTCVVPELVGFSPALSKSSRSFATCFPLNVQAEICSTMLPSGCQKEAVQFLSLKDGKNVSRQSFKLFHSAVDYPDYSFFEICGRGEGNSLLLSYVRYPSIIESIIWYAAL